MKLLKSFSQDTRLLFLYVYECGECGQNGSESGGLELHHIYGRVSDSPFNAIPICHSCHSHIKHTIDEHVRYSRKNMEILRTGGYIMNPYDEWFIRNYIAPDYHAHIKLIDIENSRRRAEQEKSKENRLGEGENVCSTKQESSTVEQGGDSKHWWEEHRAYRKSRKSGVRVLSKHTEKGRPDEQDGDGDGLPR